MANDIIERVLNVIKLSKINMIQITKNDLKGIKIGNDFVEYSIPKMQERLVCNVLNAISNALNEEFEFLELKDEYLKKLNKIWNNELDAKLGDIIVVHKGTTKVIVCIDLKVADDGENKYCYKFNRMFTGCIGKNSYEKFAVEASGKTPHWYLSMSYNGSEYIIIDAIKLKEYINTNFDINKIYYYQIKNGRKSYYIPSKWIFKHERHFCL